MRVLGLTRARLPGAGGGLRPYRALQFLTYAFSPQVDHEQAAGEWHVMGDVDAQRTHVHASSIPMDAQESSSGFRVRSIWPRQEEESALPNLKRSCEVRRRERSCNSLAYFFSKCAVHRQTTSPSLPFSSSLSSISCSSIYRCCMFL